MTDQGTDGELRGHDALLAANDRLATVLAQRNRRELTASGAVVSVFLIYAVIIPDPWVRWGCLGVAFGGGVVGATVWGACRPGPIGSDPLAWRLQTLSRQRDMLASVSWWYLVPLAPELVLCLVGAARVSGMPALSVAAGLLVLVASAALARTNGRVARQMDVEIRELQADRARAGAA